ncbi:hypothetical protein JOF56_008529 [Kibdelosporangium banguiense]|uniref:Peptidase inhibitor family I36 n=1 Tax=Kibdelosporangium banguiense TaxID=1365924 RepID=A0ABS4TUQ1_9PSEU|nr:DUF6355 family natural product biosynthesis protein [Kibdelosporangium banguiense]MBP2328144.1 hypothetical protein [Kibdelosporangium banguiense]
MKKLAIASAWAVLACIAIAPSAGAVENSSARADTFYDCGFLPAYKTPGKRAWYNHCGDGPVKIIVENIWFQDREKCVPPGLTDIEYYSGGYTTRDAWYVGGC